MRKPRILIDRDAEWARLVRLVESPRPELVFVLGRRRVGKSFLLAPLAAAAGGLYYQATRQTQAEQLRDLSRRLGEHFEDPGLRHGRGFEDWDALLLYLRDRTQEGEPLLLVLDEFPYLEDAAPALPSLLQRFLDHEVRGRPLKIVLSGSEITAMARLEAADQPLHARRTARLHLRPFTYHHVAQFVGAGDAREALRHYGAFGGVPGHLALLDSSAGFRANVVHGLLDPASRLHDEAQHMLDAFLSESRVYYGILHAIASGNQTWARITRALGLEGGSVSRPMAWLVGMELVRRVVPVTEDRPQRAKRVLYQLDDPYVDFWHRFLAPLVHAGRTVTLTPEEAFAERIEPRLDDYMGPVFERVCHDYVAAAADLPMRPSRVGAWWNRKSDEQVDVVAVAEQDVLVGECQWGRPDIRDLDRLRATLPSLLTQLGEGRRVHLALFAGQPPTDPRLQKAVSRGEVLLRTADDLFAAPRVAEP